LVNLISKKQKTTIKNNHSEQYCNCPLLFIINLEIPEWYKHQSTLCNRLGLASEEIGDQDLFLDA